MELAENPLNEVEKLLISANAVLCGEQCPNSGCEDTVSAVDHAGGGMLYVSHESDRLGTASRSESGETDGCVVSPSAADVWGDEPDEIVPDEIDVP